MLQYEIVIFYCLIDITSSHVFYFLYFIHHQTLTKGSTSVRGHATTAATANVSSVAEATLLALPAALDIILAHVLTGQITTTAPTWIIAFVQSIANHIRILCNRAMRLVKIFDRYSLLAAQ